MEFSVINRTLDGEEEEEEEEEGVIPICKDAAYVFYSPSQMDGNHVGNDGPEISTL